MRKVLIMVLTILLCTEAYAASYVFDTAIQDTVLAAEPMNMRPGCEDLDAVMSEELQEHIWQLCVARDLSREDTETYFAAMIGLAQGESEFNPRAYHDNGSSVDRGLYQVNSCHVRDLKKAGLISSSEDLYDPFVSATAGEGEFWKGYSEYGFSEESYACYLYGGYHKPNKWTKRVWDMMLEWRDNL